MSYRSVLITLLFASTCIAQIQRGLPSLSQPKIVLTSVENGLENVSEFSCADTVHGYLTLADKAVGPNTLEGIWLTPTGMEIEHSRIDLDFPPPGRRTAYIWFRFQDKADGLLGGFRNRENPSDREESFDGNWHVKVLLNGKPLVESQFKVRCS